MIGYCLMSSVVERKVVSVHCMSTVYAAEGCNDDSVLDRWETRN
jgi:hypothetical protein